MAAASSRNNRDNQDCRKGEENSAVDFIRDVNPVLSRLGCNQGTCHGAQKGKNGFKLSLRGYDPVFDTRSLSDDLGSRRINGASPHDSLMLMKPATEIAHQGGQLFEKNSKYYRLIHDWIRDGAPLDLTTIFRKFRSLRS